MIFSHRHHITRRLLAGWGTGLAALLLPLGAWSQAAPAAPASAAPPTQAQHCAELNRRLPNLKIALCEAARLQASGAKSVNGFPLYQRDVLAPVPEGLPTDKRRHPRRVLVLGGMHGDELSSTSLVFHWIAHATDTSAEMEWRFVPAVNPDGLLLPKPTRTNANKVDLNRNFPTPRWDVEAPKYWLQRTKKDPRRWPGPKPLSEPETRFVADTMTTWKPDLIVTVHAPYGVLDYDGPSVPPQRLGRLYLDQVGIFPGSLGNFGGVHKGVPVVTIELPSAIRTPTDAEMRQMWVDLLRWVSERLPAER
jgi:protein MpaA